MKVRTYINEERQSLHHQLGFRVHLEWLDRQQPRIPRIDSDAYHPNVPGNKIVEERERERIAYSDESRTIKVSAFIIIKS
jgi:hypothetical protein